MELVKVQLARAIWLFDDIPAGTLRSIRLAGTLDTILSEFLSQLLIDVYFRQHSIRRATLVLRERSRRALGRQLLIAHDSSSEIVDKTAPIMTKLLWAIGIDRIGPEGRA